jgi:hypothetical protein
MGIKSSQMIQVKLRDSYRKRKISEGKRNITQEAHTGKKGSYGKKRTYRKK